MRVHHINVSLKGFLANSSRNAKVIFLFCTTEIIHTHTHTHNSVKLKTFFTFPRFIIEIATGNKETYTQYLSYAE